MMKNFLLTPAVSVSGEIRVASDKSVSHRAVLLSALARGETVIRRPLLSEDVLATVTAVRACGARAGGGGAELHVEGGELTPPAAAINCGNSGTLMRLFAGIAAGWDIPCALTGDESLMARPMKRIVMPLQMMGAAIRAAKGVPPVEIGKRAGALQGILYSNTLGSAQVKTAILLAGLRAEDATVVAEPVPSRDHSERMLQAFGARLRRSEDGRICEIRAGELTSPGVIEVPADISSAIFFMVGAAMTPGSDILLLEVGINPSRIGALDILRRMGADIDIVNRRAMGGEPVADIRVRGGELHGVEVGAADIPSAVDDIPALLVAAATARGETRITGAGELRHKESDRLASMAAGLHALGVNCRELEDGIIVVGKNGGKPAFGGGEVQSFGDHRIAMAFAMASLRAKGEIRVVDTANVATSFPNFVRMACAAGLRIAESAE